MNKQGVLSDATNKMAKNENGTKSKGKRRKLLSSQEMNEIVELLPSPEIAPSVQNSKKNPPLVQNSKKNPPLVQNSKKELPSVQNSKKEPFKLPRKPKKLKTYRQSFKMNTTGETLSQQLGNISLNIEEESSSHEDSECKQEILKKIQNMLNTLSAIKNIVEEL